MFSVLEPEGRFKYLPFFTQTPDGGSRAEGVLCRMTAITRNLKPLQLPAEQVLRHTRNLKLVMQA